MNAPLVVYTYSACSSCRAATRWLREQGLAFIERPIYETPPTLEELERMLVIQKGELRKLFNTSGLEYRAQGLKDKLPALSKEEALSLLSREGRLVKRPFLISSRVGLVGFAAEVWQAALAPSTP